MAKDRFKGSTESTIGNEMVRWQEKELYFLTLSYSRPHPANFLKKLLVETTAFSFAFIYRRNYFKTSSFW